MGIDWEEILGEEMNLAEAYDDMVMDAYLAVQEYEERHPYAWEEERLQPDRQEPVNAPTVSVPAWSAGAEEEWNGSDGDDELPF